MKAPVFSNKFFIASYQAFTTGEALRNMNEITFSTRQQWEADQAPENEL